MISKTLHLFFIGTLLLFSSCDLSDKGIAETGTSTITGQIENLSDTTLTFTYEEYEFLSEQMKPRVKVETGKFSIQFEHDRPLKGFFSLGRIPKTYKFDFQTVEGKDSSMSVPSADFRMIYIYLEPGDSIHFDVDADALEATLAFSGKAAQNNLFVNTEEFKFNDYPHKYLGNYYNKTYRQPNDYKIVTLALRNEKIEFLNEFDAKNDISANLKKLYQDGYYSSAISSMIHYPAGHAGFNNDVYPELPDDYYGFMEEVNTDGRISNLGIGQYYFLNSYLRQTYRLENPKDSELSSFYSYAKTQLEGEEAYEFLAYALGRDFTKSLYEEFGDACPYPEMARLVKEKYQHLEGMLAGSNAPKFTLENPAGELTSLKDFRGNYIYIDFWATWCKPCVKEFPDLKRIQNQYKDKNIVFISISIDKPDDKEKWKAFVADEKLGGVQLHADQETKDRLSKALNIKSIPRFILIDSEGKIIDANAARPSNPKLVKQLSDLEL